MQNYFKRRKWHSSKHTTRRQEKFNGYEDQAQSHSFPAKKKSLGQHFLRNKSAVRNMIERVAQYCSNQTVLEIGCGDGFLTEQILAQTNCKKLVCLEIDSQWAEVVATKIKDPRLTMLNVNALDHDWSTIGQNTPIVLLANLPYNVSIPLIKKLKQNAKQFTAGVFMVQEEVAQKIVAKAGRSFGSFSMFLQHTFDFDLMQKIDPQSFCPPPQVDSRLVYFKPKAETINIDREDDFWRFIKACFSSPRRMLRNNIANYNFDKNLIDQHIGGLRAQQMSFEQLLNFWNLANNSSNN